MDRRCAAGALLALAACIASTAAAPTSGNQTALDVYDGASEGCYYNFQHYGEGDRIMTNEPCLNCTCHNRMLMCYLRVCPFTKPIGQDCSVEKRADQCCPIVTCPDVDLLTSTSTSSPAEYGETGLGKLDRYGCSINGKYFSEGSKVPSTPNKPCEHCYCIRNMTTCVMQECTLHVDGCTPIYHKEVCCPVRYSCDHPEDEIPLLDDMTTTVRPTPGFLLTTTTLSSVTQMTQDCVHDDKVFADGALIKTEKACEHCYCMKGDIVCVVQECGTPMENEGKNCTSMPPREGQCCPDTYICEGDELTTETKTDFTTVSSLEPITTLKPPRRVNVEGSGYRNEPDEPFTEIPTFEPDTEGSGEGLEQFKPIDASGMFIPERETTTPFITTEHDKKVHEDSLSTTKTPITDIEITEKETTEPDKGDNTVPIEDINEYSSKPSMTDITPVSTTESYFDAKTTAEHEDNSSIGDITTTKADTMTSKPVPVAETTVADYQSSPYIDNMVTADDESIKNTEPTPGKEDVESTESESTTFREIEKYATTVSDFMVPDALTTESDMAYVEQVAKTTTAQLPEQDNEILIKEQTTDPTLEPSTRKDITKIESEPPTTKQPETSTELSSSGHDHFVETTSVDPVDNEIDEESYPTSLPGRIPGEGDCLLDGVTYNNESIVPSSNNCHSACRCISSIVKCDPIICSLPPDYMDNCQPMYDPPDSCCPTYVCDHTKETIPPQPHSQMSGTESPVSTPVIECDGDQCDISKDKNDSLTPSRPCTSEGCSDDSSKKPDICGTGGCLGLDKNPDHHPSGSSEECAGEKCTSPQENCAAGNCETPITKDQTCDGENSCKTSVDQLCQGENCKNLPQAVPEVNSGKDDTSLCNNSDECNNNKVPERTSDCEGETCKSGLPPKIVPTETADCKDVSDCTQPDQTPAIEECNEDSCIKKPLPDISKPPIAECTDSECISQDNIPKVTDGPELYTEIVPKATELPGTYGTKSEESVTDLPKTTDIDKEEEPSKTTAVTISVKTEEPESTTHFDESDQPKKKEPQLYVTVIPEIETQSTEIHKHDSPTETTIQKETTISPLDDKTIMPEIVFKATTQPSEEIITDVPNLFDTDTKGAKTELPSVAETELPESVTKPKDPTLVGDHQSEAVTVPQDTNVDLEPEITTTAPIPINQDVSTGVTQVTTESQEKQTDALEHSDLDRQGDTTKEPEYKPEQHEGSTEISGAKDPLYESKKPEAVDKYAEPNVTEPSEDTTLPNQQSIDKFDEKPVKPEITDKYTTPKSYDSETNASLETKSPMQDVSEETLDSNTMAPEKLSTSLQEQEEGKQETELPVLILTSEESITSKPGEMTMVTESMLSQNTNDEPEEPETKLPESDLTEITSKPEITLDDAEITRAPQFTPVSDEEPSTKPPLVGDISQVPEIHTVLPVLSVTQSDEMTTNLPKVTTAEEQRETGDQPLQVTGSNTVETETPLSIIKDEEVETKPGQTSPTDIHSAEEELSTKKPESFEPPMPHPTETYITEPDKTLSEKPEKDIIKMPSLSDEEHVHVATDKIETNIEDTTILPVFRDESSTEQQIKGTETTEIPVSYTSTVKTPVSVSLMEEPTSSEHAESAVTESVIQQTDAPHENISEIIPVTSIPDEAKDTKLPESLTEIPTQTMSEEMDIITPTQEQSGIHKDVSTEIPELTIHEHTDSSLITMEMVELLTEKVATEAPTTESQDTSQKAETRAPELQDNATNTPEIPVTDLHKDTFVTMTPEQAQTELNGLEPQDNVTNIPEISATEPQKVATEAPETQEALTEVPETTVSEQKNEVTKASGLQDITTSVPEIPVTELTKDMTVAPELQGIVTNVSDLPVTETLKDITESPELQDSVTKITEISTKGPQKESTEIPESYNMVTNVPEITQTIDQEKSTVPLVTQDFVTVTEISTTESQKDVTEALDMYDIHKIKPEISVTESQDTTTNIPEILSTETQKEVTDKPDTQDSATNAPNNITKKQEESSELPEIQDVASNVPEVSGKEPTEIPVAQDIATNISKISVTEPQKEVTITVVSQDATNIPETEVTKPQREATDTPLTQDTATNIPELSVTEIQKDVTEKPELYDTTSKTQEILPQNEVSQAQEHTTYIPDITGIDLHKEVTAKPESLGIDTITPKTTDTELTKEITETTETNAATDIFVDISTDKSQMEVTEVPKAPTVSDIEGTEPQKEITEAPEQHTSVTNVPEITVTDTQTIVTNTSETPATELQKETSEPQSESPEVATNVPDISTTIPHEGVTINTEQDFVTKAPERTQTEASEIETNTDFAVVTKQDGIITEAPLKVTTKLEDHTEPEIILQTESPNTDSDSLLPVEGVLQNEQSTEIPESLVTESQDKTDTVTYKPTTDKPHEEEMITEIPIEEPTKASDHVELEKSDFTTILPILSESVEPGTKSPQSDDTELQVTKLPELYLTEKQEYETQAPESQPQGSKSTETTSQLIDQEDSITKSPEQLEPQHKTTLTSEEPNQTSESKYEYPETTPYLVILDEHTHKKDINTMSPDYEISTLSSGVSSDYEQSTPETNSDMITESIPTLESEKPSQEEATEKDESVQIIETTMPDKITEPSLVFEETTTKLPSLVLHEIDEAQITVKPDEEESNEISTSAPTPGQEQKETEKPLVPSTDGETDNNVPLASEKPYETTAPEEEFIPAITKATTIKIEEELTTQLPLTDNFGKPAERPKPDAEPEKLKPDTTEEIPKPVVNEVQTTEETPQPDGESNFPSSGTSSYGQEPDYAEEDQPFGPGTCRYGGKVYVSAQQIPRDDPCDFCFCFRSDIICLQQSCPPPIHGCHEEPIQGFCCPRYECPVSMATTLNVTTTTTTTTTTLPPHFLPHAYKGAAQRRGCQIKGHTYKVGEVVRASSGPCLHCTCGGDGQMKCDPKVCTPEPMLRQMIAAAVSAKRRR